LYPLPALLRGAFPHTPTLHFTHIPFPDSATLKLIPQSWRDTILHGLLGADVVGMQTEWDVRPFLSCCEELISAEVDYKHRTVISRDGRCVRVRAFPASTDPAEIAQAVKSPGVQAARERLSSWKEKQTIIRVDRLDPSKNQLIGFRAFGRLLELRPDLRCNLRFLAFLVPSRTDLGVYRAYRDAVYTAINEVNARYGDECGEPPIAVFYTNDREQALAAMEQCDVLLVNSREDGMNLVVKEWAIVSQRPGVAIVSETAGVASVTGDSALLVCPLDIEGTARAMDEALDMPQPDRWKRLQRLRQSVYEWDAAQWLRAQLEALGVS
jgi:trehalose 6-phosphate synthase